MSVIAILAKCAAFSLLVRVPEEGLLLPFLFFFISDENTLGRRAEKGRFFNAIVAPNKLSFEFLYCHIA